MTKKQHYIPQVYLRGFSPEYLSSERKKSKREKHTIYFYDLKKEQQSVMPIPIKSVCYENDLYEVTGENGDIVLPNFLEKCFSELENMFGKYRADLERKVFQKSNYEIKCFLKKEEKAFWVTYIILQIMRLPEVLKLAEEVGRQTLGNEFPNHQIKSAMRYFCLPLFKEIEPNDPSAAVIEYFLDRLKNMNFAVGVDYQGRIITSDNPVFVCTKETQDKEFERIIFPISAQICLLLFRSDDKNGLWKNCCFEIDEAFREEIIKSMSSMAFNKIYSNHILDKREKKYIKDITMDRKKSGEDEELAVL